MVEGNASGLFEVQAKHFWRLAMPSPQTVILGCGFTLLCLLWLIDEFLNAPIVDDCDDHERKLIADMKRRGTSDAA